METVGRRRYEVWERVTLLEGGRRWKCNDCGEEFAGGASRIKAHVNKVKGTGIRSCKGKANSNTDTDEHNLLHSQGKVIMEKVGRRRDEVWEQVTLLEGGRRWKCNDCGEKFAGGASRIKAHVNKVKGIGIRPCKGKANSNTDTDEHNLLHSQGQIQVDDAEDQERTQDLQMMKKYVFECLRPEDMVIVSPLSYLPQEEFITLKPETSLDSLVIDTFVEILTDIERKKKTMPLNWYLPVSFSDAALKGKVSYFLNFVHCQKITENYMSNLESCDKIFIPVHVGARPNGHFYLCIIHLKNKEIEIWDSLPNTSEAEIEETTKKLLFAMEKLFKKVTFTEFHLKMANDILLQPNGFDCGVFVMNYMQQSDNYVKRDSSFQFDSKKEREDLALKLLNNDLNKEKQNLYDKARRHYAQVEKQDGNKRLRVDPSKEHFEDVGREMEVEYDDCNEADDYFDQEYGDKDEYGLENGQIQGDAKYQERIHVGSSFVSNWNNEDLQMIQFVFECLSPGEYVFRSPRLHLTQNEFITLKSGTWLNSWVIDTFVEILTESEKKKATPSNCYLPLMFSKEALNYVEHNFKEDFVQQKKIRENYLFHIKSPEKVFIPVRTEQKIQGHFYLYIFHLNKKVVEIWDSLPTFVAETDRDETTKKLFFAMEILFKQKKEAFSDYQKEMANDILSQDNGFDCGVFVINYMQQSYNYVKRKSSFQFDSKKEREDLALKLLTNDLNQEKQNLYDKARGRLYSQVEKKDGNERLRVDASETFIEAKYDDRVNRHDGLQKGSSKGYLLPTTDLMGKKFQRYTKQILEWIMDDKVSAIGVWGIGGSGKTALATDIHNKLILKEAGSDIKVIWVTVSQKYSISHLQKVIARSIELDISDEFEVKRIAGKLLQAFKEMKKCIVILDDVWDHLLLKEIGFPMSDDRIKFILTTRILEVCQGMGCEKNTVKVESLDEEDSWVLFEKIMGFHEELSFAVKKIARDISCKCEGLPLAIVRIATSMKVKKHVREWSHMLECLENLGDGQYGMDKWVFPVLRSSYDFLNNKLQRFFLYCAVISTTGYFDDEKANHLIRIFVYESIDETKKLRVKYDEGYNMLDILKNHSMLERYDEQWMMNKFLGALAINIAEDTGKIMANAYKNLTKIPSDDQWKDDLQKAFLTGNKIKTIPDGTCLRCSQLSTLLLNGNVDLNYISDDIFKNMPTLKILDLSRTCIKLLPKSVSNLKCLTALLLSECRKLSYIPSLSKLKQLISLDISDTAITKEPMGLESLVNLRCLNLYCTYMLMSASLKSKLINLDNLEFIVACFHDISIFNAYVSFLDEHHVLRSYHLTLENSSSVSHYEGINKEYSMKRITFRDMDLRNRKAVFPGDIKELFIIRCQLVGMVGSCICSVVLSYGHNNNNNRLQIERLEIIKCKDVEYLYCFSGSCPFCSSSQLVGCLFLEDLNLKDIVSPDDLLFSHQSSLFSHLTRLEIHDCNDMKTLMTPKLLALFQNLRTIIVYYCMKMEAIVGEDDHSQMELTASGDLMALAPNTLSHPTPITFPRLTSLELYHIPQLNFVHRGIMLCPYLQTFYAYDCKKLNPPRIKVSKGCKFPLKKTPTGYHWEIKTD